MVLSSIYQKRGIYYLGIRVGDKTVTRSLKTKSLVEARRQANKLEQELTGVKLSRLLRLWGLKKTFTMKLAQPNGKVENSRYIRDVTNHTNRFIKWFGDKSSSMVDRDILLMYQMELKNEGLNTTSIAIHLRSLRSVFNWGYKTDLIPNQAFKGFSIPEGNRRREFLELTEIDQLLKVVEERPLIQNYINFLIRTGCRPIEFYRLMWTDIKERHLVFKGKTGEREFPLFQELKEILNNIEKFQGDTKGEYVLIFEKGNRIVVNELSKLVRRYSRRTKINKIVTPYVLRHTFGSQLVIKGISIFRVSRLLGHSSVITTEKYYTHLRPHNFEEGELHF